MPPFPPQLLEPVTSLSKQALKRRKAHAGSRHPTPSSLATKLNDDDDDENGSMTSQFSGSRGGERAGHAGLDGARQAASWSSVLRPTYSSDTFSPSPHCHEDTANASRRWFHPDGMKRALEQASTLPRVAFFGSTEALRACKFCREMRREDEAFSANVRYPSTKPSALSATANSRQKPEGEGDRAGRSDDSDCDINSDLNYGVENDPDYELDKAPGYDLDDSMMTTSTPTPTMKRPTTPKTNSGYVVNNHLDYGLCDQQHRGEVKLCQHGGAVRCGQANLPSPSALLPRPPGRGDAFQLPDDDFRRQYRLSKAVVRWLCEELRSAPGLRRRRTIASAMTVEQQVLCALRFFGTGSFQGMVATDEHLSVSQMTVSRAVRVAAAAIVECLGSL
ncbi:hypothetical protein HPB47_021770 [Ixodes persulcatus]|uniref:Uncharacterized protein n=1 Tax=Ixodes persulcatus TaxID=34615 RepID=A0AC60QCJ9_IXOPE|nr:hypothetical protein HPB47_021770 [Ixodes persulcatus]